MEIKLTYVLFWKRKEILKFFMRTFLLLCCTSVMSFSSGNLFSQDAKVAIDSDKTVTIFEVFELIGKQTECTFIYQSDIFQDVPEIRLKSGVIKVMTLLSQILPVKNFEINSNKNNLIIISRKSSFNLQHKNIEIKGIIKNSNDMPIAGATIIVKGTNRGTTSDFDGNYTISANPEDILIISHLGYTTLTIPIQNRSAINITLQEDATELGEVQINAGYYTTTDREKTGSIARITAKEIEGQPVNNPLEALMGRLTGVDVVPTSGVPGSGIAIKIRGISSLMAGTTPLYIIDGVPFSGNSTSNSDISGQIMPSGTIDPFQVLNPALIESIEVLKDADATAIYGSRGANGVILITTKKGKKGQTRFSFVSSTGVAHVAKKLELLNTQQYLDMRANAFTNDGYTNYPANAYDINGTWDQNKYTDWQELLIGGTAHTRSLQATTSGGNEQTTFLLSGMYNNETTVFPGEFRFNRFNINSQIAHSNKSKKFNMQFNAGYGHTNNLQPRKDLTFEALTLPPNAPALFDESGALNWENNTWTNPLAFLQATYQNETRTLLSSLNLSYTLHPNLVAKVNMGYTQSNFNERYLQPHTVINPAFGASSSRSRLFKNDHDIQSWIVEPQLNWEYEKGRNKTQILIGATFQKQNDTQFHIGGIGFANNTLINNLSAAQTVLVMGQNEVVYNYQSTFARFNYAYNGTLLLNLTGRRDGSSRFGPGNRYGNFGAVGAAWVFSKSINQKWLNLGKIRGSYGITGNDQIGDYQYLLTYTINNNFGYNGNLGLLPSRQYNPNFKWEQNGKFELGLEMDMVDNRLGLQLAYYRNRSSNQLVAYALPATTGFPSINRNLDATVENKGWELELRGTLLQSQDWNWNLNANITIPKNELVAFPGLETSTYANRYAIGEPLQIVKLYKSNGVNPETGLFEFQDHNGDGLITSADRQYITDLAPKFYGGVSNTLTYKQWNLDVFFQFSKKNGYNLYRYGLVPGSMYNQPTTVLDNWEMSGTEADMQRFSSGNNAAAYVAYSRFSSSTGTVSDASFIRLKTLALSYTLKLNNTQCKVYLQGQNLLTWTPFKYGDPEQSLGNLPVLRRFLVGLNLEL